MANLAQTVLLACLCPQIFGAQIDNNPPDIGSASPLWIRLQTPVSTLHSKPGDPLEAIVAQPLIVNGSVLLASGSRVRGAVGVVAARRRSQDRASLRLDFTSIEVDGRSVPLQARVSAIDNARETVDPDGTIQGLRKVRKRPDKVELLLLLAAHAHPYALAAIEGERLIAHEVQMPQIEYGVGVDLALTLREPPDVAGRPLHPVPPTSPRLAELLLALPNRTAAKNTTPSDWVNLAFVGSESAISAGFAAGGWDPADRLSLRSDIRTFFAVARHEAYADGPVSTLLLAGKPPDLVFQKQTNTFSMRHHIRIWSTGTLWNGQPLWLAAATHDIGIDFSKESKTFSHKVETNVDLERTKVINDLFLTGRASLTAMIDRPSVPDQSRNATGDQIRTDGRLAVVLLRPEHLPTTFPSSQPRQ